MAGGGYEPPDVVVAAGPGAVVEMVNVAARIFRPANGALQPVQTIPLGSLFHSGGDRLTDPRVLYDAASGRWFASVSDVDGNSVLLAVSRSVDPAGAWTVYTFDAGGCADQPRVGLADGVVVLAADVFSNCNEGLSPVLGGELWIVNKQQAVAGASTVSSSTYGPTDALSSLAPVQSLSSTGTEYVVSVDDPSSRVVHLLAVDGVPPAPVRVQEVATIAIPQLTEPPAAQEPAVTGGFVRPATIATNDDRVLDSVWENGKLWFSANTSCTPAGDVLLRSCGRVVELSTAARTLDWSSDVGAAGSYVFFPALRPDAAGNVDVVYGESSSTVAPQVDAVSRLPDGTFTAPVVLAQSRIAHVGSRYGDYFGAARDPVTPSVVWVAGETTGDTPDGRGWTTVVAAVQASGPLAGVPAASPPAPPSVRALSTTRTGATVRLAYATLADGTAIRVELTVAAGGSTVFRTTTPAATVHADRTYSVLWRPAKKLHGAMTFCARTLDATGNASAKSCTALMLRR